MKRATLLLTLLCLFLSCAPGMAFALEGDDLTDSAAHAILAEPEENPDSETPLKQEEESVELAKNESDSPSSASDQGLGKSETVAPDTEPLDEGSSVGARVENEKPSQNDVKSELIVTKNVTTDSINDTSSGNNEKEKYKDESNTLHAADSSHEHQWSDWVQTKAPTYYTSGVKTRTCLQDPAHTETEVIPAFGPAEGDLATELADGEYGEGVGVRLLYTRPVELHYLSAEDYASPCLYRTVPIDLSNPVIPGNDIAVRYTGDDPYIVIVYMGTNRNSWLGWTAVGATKVVTVADGTGQKVAIFCWEKLLEQWNSKFDVATSYQATERAAGRPDPMFDMLSVAARENQSLTLAEVVSLSNVIHHRPEMKDVSENINVTELVEDLGAGMNFSGMFESNYKPPTPAKDGGWGQADINLEAHWSRGTYVTKQMISDVKARGFSSVRIPVTWYQHIYEYNGDPYHIDRAWMQRVHEVVDWCLEEDLYVIINIHHEDWINRPDLDTAYDKTDLPEKFAAVWTQIANEFYGYDQRLIFEDLNEPRASGAGVDHEREWSKPWPGDVRTINNLHNDFIDLIRNMPADSRHQQRLIMCPLYSPGEQYPELHYVVPHDPAGMLAVSVHNYTPHNFTHYDDGHSADHEIEGNWAGNVYIDSYRENLYRSFENIRQRYTSKGIPVVLGEFGSYYCGESRQADRLQWMTEFITYAKQLGLPCFIWGMDRTTDANVKVWNVYDQNRNVWSAQSSALIDKWFEILADPKIVWGENALVADDEHLPIESGTALAFGADSSGSKHIYKDDVSGSDKFRTGSIFITEDVFDGKDLAVKFTGATPYIAVCDKDWKGWTTIQPYYVDTTSGIAYFSEQGISWRWSGKEGTVGTNSNGTTYTVGPIGRLHICTSAEGTAETGGTWVLAVALVHVHDWNDWVMTTEPTCTEAGELTRTCTEGDSTQTHAVKAHGHVDDGGVVTREATLFEEGVITHSCQTCGAVLSTETIPTLQPGEIDYGDPFALSAIEAVLAGGGFQDIIGSVTFDNLADDVVPFNVGQLSGKVIGGFRLSGDTRVMDAEVTVSVSADAAHEGDVLALYRLASDAWVLATYAQVAGGAFVFETAGIVDAISTAFAVVNKSAEGGPASIGLATLDGADYPTKLWNAIKQGGSFTVSPDAGVVSANKFYLDKDDGRYANRLEFHGLSLYCADTANGGKNNGFTFLYSGEKELYFEGCTFDHCDFLFNQAGTYVFVNCVFKNFPRNAIASQADGAKVFVYGCTFMDNAPDKDIWNSNVEGDRHANYAAIRLRGNDTALRVAGSTFSNLQTDSTIIVQAQSGNVRYDNVTVCFERNTVLNCGGAGLVLDSAARGRVDANTFTNIGATRGMNGYQSTIHATLGEYDENGNGAPGAGVGGNALFARGNNYQMRVRDNTITNVMENGIEGTYYSISGNTVDTTGYRYDDESGDSYNGGYHTVSTDGISGDGTWFITDNTVLNVHQRGITITRWGNHEVLVSGNTISRREGGSTYAESSEGIKVRTDETSYANVTISGNTLSGFENNYRVLHAGGVRTCENVVIVDANDGKLMGSVLNKLTGVKLTTARDEELSFANGGVEGWRQSNLTSFVADEEGDVAFVRIQPKDANGRVWQTFNLPDQTCIVCLEIKVRSSNPTVRVFVTSRDASGAMLDEADGGSYREYKIPVRGIDANGFTTQYVCLKARGATDLGFWTTDDSATLDIASVRGWYAVDDLLAPAGQDDPQEPDNPGGSGDPDNPQEPGGSDNPENPDDPAEPGDPAEPDNPKVPDNPGGSDNPNVPEEPGTPENPSNQGDSEEPENLAPLASYEIVLNPDGTWEQGSGDEYTFSSNADFSKFEGVSVDNVLLATSCYSAVSGSTKVTLHADYLATLAVGMHTVVIHSSDGNASTTFTIVEQSSGSEGKSEGEGVVAKVSSSTSSADSAQTKAVSRADDASSAATSEAASTLPKTGDTTVLAMLFAAVLALASGFVLKRSRSRS